MIRLAKLSCLALLFLMLALPQVVAQDKLKVSEKAARTFKLKAPFIRDVFETSDGEFWSLSYGKGNYYVARYDRNLNFVGGKYIYFRYFGKFLSLEKVVMFKGKYMMFLTYTNELKRKEYLFYTIFDPDDLITEEEIYKVAELPAAEKRMTAPEFSIEVSADDNHLLITGIPPSKVPRKKGFRGWLFGSPAPKALGKGSVSFSFWVIDRKMRIVNYEKKHRLEIENAGDRFEFRAFMVDEDGTIYILGKNKLVEELKMLDRRRQNSKKWVDYRSSAFILEQVRPNGETQKFVTENDVLYNDMNILFGKDGSINLVGLLAEEHVYNIVTTGIERIVLSKDDLSIVRQTNDHLTEEVLDKVNNIRVVEASLANRKKRKVARQENRMSPEEKEFKELAKRAALKMNFIAYCGMDDNDQPLIVLEERYLVIVTTTSTDSRGIATTTTTYYYHYDDLIMVRFAEDSIFQGAVSKDFVSINRELDNPLAVTLDGDDITVMAQDRIFRTSGDLQHIDTYQLKGDKRRTRGNFGYAYIYKKDISKDLIVAASQRRKNTTWFKIQVK